MKGNQHVILVLGGSQLRPSIAATGRAIGSLHEDMKTWLQSTAFGRSSLRDRGAKSRPDMKSTTGKHPD